MTPNRTCEFSPCRKWRYTLWREWELKPDELFNSGSGAPFSTEYLMCIGLNPSTADESRDDPTIRRVIGYAKRWGFGALCMTNLFAWRDTDPRGMKAATFPVGGDNDMWLRNCAAGAGMILAAWGTHGSFLERGKTVVNDLRAAGRTLHCLTANADGSPKHPLYCRSDLQPIPLP